MNRPTAPDVTDSAVHRRHLVVGAAASAALGAVGTAALGGPASAGAPGGAAAPRPRPALPAGKPVPAAAGLLALLDQYQVVAVSEAHWNQNFHDMFLSVVMSPGFADLADAVVVEWGNRRYQRTADAFVSGKAVAWHELARCWRDTTVSPQQTWDAPVYFRLLSAIRALNVARPRRRPVRVLLGDPPVDWSAVRSPEDVVPLIERRNDSMAEVVERQLLDRGRRGFFLAGTLHVVRNVEVPGPDRSLSAGHQLWKRHRGKVVLVGLFQPSTHNPLSDRVERRIAATWPDPGVQRLGRSWPAREPAAAALDFVPLAEGLQLADVADVLLWVGRHDDQVASVVDPGIYFAPEYWSELQRRNAIFGDPYDLEVYRREQPPGYWDGLNP